MAVASTIRIHRRKLVAFVNGEPVKLTRDEHELMVALGIMDNRLVPHDVLLDVMCDGRMQIPADKVVLLGKVYRLQKKLGPEAIRNSRGLGYVLSGDVQFVG